MGSKEVHIYHPNSPMLEKEGVVPPLALAQFGAILKERGHKVAVNDARGREVDIRQLMACDVLIFSSVTTPQYPVARRQLKEILSVETQTGRRPLTAIGGPHATYLGKDVLEDGWDIVCEGFGERVVGPLVEGEINKGLVTGPMLTESELNELPRPDFTVFKDLDTYRRTSNHDPTLPVMCSRGCPHDCSFCSNRAWKRLVSFYNPERVIQMVEDVHNLGYKQIVMYDDDALINKADRVSQISQGIKDFQIAWRCNTHVNTIDNKAADKKGLLDMIRDAGCKSIALGVDGPDNEALEYFNKETTIDRCYRAVEKVKKAGILAKVYLIYIPGGGMAYAKRMTDFIEKADPQLAQISVKQNMPGSDDWEGMLKNLESSGKDKPGRNEYEEYYYCGKDGRSGGRGLNEEDHDAINYLHDYMLGWRAGKPEMPV